jgi:hypothetical protein
MLRERDHRFFVSDANVLDHGAQRHDLPAGLLRLMARLLNRTPSKRPSCEEVSMLLDKIMAESIEVSYSLCSFNSIRSNSNSRGS